MRYFIFLILASLIISGCASTSVTSFTDPDYKGKQFDKILIIGNTNRLDYRMNIEDKLKEYFLTNGIEAISSYNLFPPTREFSDVEKFELMLGENIDGCVMINFGESGIKQVKIPITGSKTKGKVNKNYDTYNIETETEYIGGQTLSKPYAEFEVKLFDVSNGNTVWIANSFTGGSAYASFNTVYNSFCKKIVEKLSKDKLILTTKEAIRIRGEEIRIRVEEIERLLQEKEYELLNKDVTNFSKNSDSTDVIKLKTGEIITGKIIKVEKYYGWYKVTIIDKEGDTHRLVSKEIFELKKEK